MRILVVNGSPKGKYSVTLQTLLFLEKKFAAHEFEYLHAGQQINALAKDFSKAEKALRDADLIIFSYPVYTCIATSQLHRFISLLKSSGLDISGKFAAQITTSKHFYDFTAHKYIEENCCGLGLKYIRGLSADMDDLTTEKGQKEAEEFMRYVLWCAENNIYEPAKDYSPAKRLPVTPVAENSEGKSGDVVIVADLSGEDKGLKDMISRFRSVSAYKTRIVNLADIPMKGGCLGCFRCAPKGECVYDDGFAVALKNEIHSADAIVYAFTIKDHSMGWLFKQYDDRQFCNGHRPVTKGKPVGYLIGGNYPEEANLKAIIEARSEVGGNFLAGVAYDQTDPDGEIDNLARKLAYAIENKLSLPANFYGVGGMKVFRDMIWLMRGLMKADHKFYKKKGLYDFPQRKVGTLIKMYFAGAFFSNEKLKARIGMKAINEGMLMPYKKVIDKACEKKG